MKRSLASTFLFLVLATPAWAGFDEGVKAYKQGDYATALREMRPLAVDGDVRSQYGLGVMYARGQGVPQDQLEAVKWYRKAAEQGHADAQFNLAVMYAKGRGVARDDAAAVAWYRKAAEQGNTYAQTNLANMYRRGQGVAENLVEAHKWYNIAAMLGQRMAYNLRNRIANIMTPAQIAEAQKSARAWMDAFKKRNPK